MKKILCCYVFGIIASLYPHPVMAEDINSFSTDISVEKNGTIAVSETIEYDFGSLDRHGIFRTIPYIKINEDGKKYQLKYTGIRVEDENGKSYEFSTSKENENLKIKIGDPDKTISGTHTYIITYTVAGALSYFSDHVELYWNSTGVEWEIPIRIAESTITFPQTIKKEDLSAKCFTGSLGNTDENCISKITNKVYFETKSLLSSYEGLTIVVSFPTGIVDILEPKEYIPFWETPFGIILYGMLLVLGVLAATAWYVLAPAYVIYRWHMFGRDPKPPMGVTSAWFEAPKTKTSRKLTPGETGALIDESADLRDIFATIVDLARRGFLKIIENKKNDYTLMKIKDPGTNNLFMEHEIKLFDSLFKSGDLLKLKGASLISEIQDVQNSIYTQLVAEDFFPENPKKIRDVYLILAGVSLFTANFPLFIVCITFGLAMPRKTMRGAQEANVARSLKNFLSSQEAKLEYQAKNYMFFEKFLPFAIAFGVEKIWATRFADISMKSPDWYISSSPGGSFRSTMFVNSLSSSFAGVTSAATPTRSSSGFSSGSSGSSGGGGGGGGGGSW